MAMFCQGSGARWSKILVFHCIFKLFQYCWELGGLGSMGGGWKRLEEAGGSLEGGVGIENVGFFKFEGLGGRKCWLFNRFSRYFRAAGAGEPGRRLEEAG